MTGLEALTAGDMAALVAAALGGYLLGAVPFGLVLTRLAGLGDIRAIGSGNIGATNVLRTGRKDLALATLLLDAGKAGLAALAAGALVGPTAGLVAGGAAFLGHLYPVWLKFRGGKGVATFFGALLITAWPVGLAAAAAWLATAFGFRYSSLGALVAALIAPLAALLTPRFAMGDWGPLPGGPGIAGLAAFMGVLIFWRHRDNIRRLLNGTEPRIGSAAK